MKFYCAGKLLHRIEEQDYTLLFGADIKTHGRGHIKKNAWGAGWIYEADDSFRSWCVIAYGFEPVVINELEFNLLVTSGTAFLSKDRTLELRKPVMSQLSLIAINS